MILHVVEARYERDYVIHVRFNDGAEGFVDLADELHGEMFAPLQDIEKFKTFRVDPELETICWENGADFAPEFLHSRLLVPAQTGQDGSGNTRLERNSPITPPKSGADEPPAPGEL